MPHEWAKDAATIRDLAAGRLPAGVDPDSDLGRRYRALIERVAEDLARAPEPSDAQVTRIVGILRGAPLPAGKGITPPRPGKSSIGHQGGRGGHAPAEVRRR